MARRRVADPVTIHSWEEADALLGQIAERQREVTRIELEMNQRIAVLKENAKAAVKVHQTEIAAGEKQLALFAAQHREDFGKGKSKPLTHGVIGWRQSTTVKLLRSVADTVAVLLKNGHGECVRQAAPQVDKQAVRQLSEVDRTAAGIQMTSEDVFFLGACGGQDAGGSAMKASDKQRRMLYGLARKAGMDQDLLHARCLAVTGKEHISALTSGECARLIDSLQGGSHAAKQDTRPLDRAGQGQINLILGLARKLGWLENGSKTRLNAFLRARFGAERLNWLDPEQASKVTEALKAMLQGGRGERVR